MTGAKPPADTPRRKTLDEIWTPNSADTMILSQSPGVWNQTHAGTSRSSLPHMRKALFARISTWQEAQSELGGKKSPKRFSHMANAGLVP